MIRDPATADLSTPGRLEALVPRWSGVRGPSIALADARGDWSWRDLEHGRKQLAELLLTLGVRAGDRVMVVGENCAPLVALFAAVASVHGWFVPVDAKRSPRSLDAIRAHASPRRVLFLGDDCADARDHAQRVKAMRISLGRWGTLSVSPLDERCVPEPYEDNPRRDVAALIYRCGDNDPSAVMLTHANLAFVARVMAELRGIGPEDRIEASIPVSSAAGLALCLAALGAGAQVRIAPPAPAAASRAGTPQPSYGLAEASSLVALARRDERCEEGAAGQALPGVALRIVDGERRDVAPGEIGELLVRGPNVMKGYYRDPDATAAALIGGWLATGDLARLGPEGALFIEGRVAAPPEGLNAQPAPGVR